MVYVNEVINLDIELPRINASGDFASKKYNTIEYLNYYKFSIFTGLKIPS